MNTEVIFIKDVDRSLLKEGFTIPADKHDAVYRAVGKVLEHGESQEITLLLDGVAYDALLKNINFSLADFAEHGDLLQIRYKQQSALAKKLRSVFTHTQTILTESSTPARTHSIALIPTDEREKIELCACGISLTMYIRCIPKN